MHTAKMVLAPMALAIGLVGCGSDSDDNAPQQVKIDYNSYGVPHITASNYE